MQNWDLVLQAGGLKARQEEIQSCYTRLVDEAKGMQEILGRLQERWQGAAAVQYVTKGYQVLSEFYEELEKLQELVASFEKIEKGFMTCEKKIAGMIK